MIEISPISYSVKTNLFTLLAMAVDIFEGNRQKGFWDNSNLYQKRSLISSEVSEALEAARGGLPPMFVTTGDIETPVGDSVESCMIGGVFYKPDGFAYELADVAIRCLDFLGSPYAMDELEGNRSILDSTICPFFQLKGAALTNALDCLSLTLQVAEVEGLDIVALVKTKLAYNATRPTKHGKKF